MDQERQPEYIGMRLTGILSCARPSISYYQSVFIIQLLSVFQFSPISNASRALEQSLSMYRPQKRNLSISSRESGKSKKRTHVYPRPPSCRHRHPPLQTIFRQRTAQTTVQGTHSEPALAVLHSRTPLNVNGTPDVLFLPALKA